MTKMFEMIIFEEIKHIYYVQICLSYILIITPGNNLCIIRAKYSLSQPRSAYHTVTSDRYGKHK